MHAVTYRDEVAVLIEVVALVKVGRSEEAALAKSRKIPCLWSSTSTG
jgi:hypothetical protein